MHEFGLVKEVHDRIVKSGKKDKAKVVIGALKSVDPDTFEEMFFSLAQDTDLANMKINIELVPLVIKCSKCGFEGKIKDVPHLHSAFISWPCPKCGSDSEILSGNELEVKELE
ncbi:hydrogenase maturation nickel metallochaperone HypA [archaeon]|nr:hydrogenase maturation nickel metallochaperone HypA [archaeon]